MIKVLLVDDDTEMQKCLGGYLKTRGFSIRCAGDGEETFRMIEEDRPDCVLLDIQLPGNISGIGILKKIKETNPDIKVLMMTGYIDHEKEEKCKSLGANGYIMKPLSYPELEPTIKSTIGK